MTSQVDEGDCSTSFDVLVEVKNVWLLVFLSTYARNNQDGSGQRRILSIEIVEGAHDTIYDKVFGDEMYSSILYSCNKIFRCRSKPSTDEIEGKEN